MFWLMYVGILFIISGEELFIFCNTKVTTVIGSILKSVGILLLIIACSSLHDEIEDLDRRLDKIERRAHDGCKRCDSKNTSS